MCQTGVPVQALPNAKAFRPPEIIL
jgi:hypothetical protein